MTARIFARRLRIHEATQILDLNQSPAGTIFRESFAHHDTWVRRLLREVASGIRVVFVATTHEHPKLFASLPDFPAGDVNRNLPLGCVALKRGAYSHEVELKNFLIQKTEDEPEVAKVLLSKAKLFCEKRGFRRLITLLPEEDKAAIRHHIDFGFRIEAPSERAYGREGTGIGLYQMSLQLTPTYVGDPFDLPMMAKWILKTCYNFSQGDNALTEDPKSGASILSIKFTAAKPSHIGSEYRTTENSTISSGRGSRKTDNENDLPALSGNAVVIQGQLDSAFVADYLEKCAEDLCMIFTLEETAPIQRVCRKRRITNIGPKLLSKICGERSGNIKSPELVRGLITFLGKRYADQLKLHDGKAAYVLRSGLGEFVLSSNDDKDEEQVRLLVFASEETAQSTGATFPVYGYARVTAQPQPWHPEEILNSWPKDLLLLTSIEFEHYVNGLFANESSNSTLLLIQIDEIKMFDSPFDGASALRREGLDPITVHERSMDVYIGSDFTHDLLAATTSGSLRLFEASRSDTECARVLRSIMKTVDKAASQSQETEAYGLIESIREEFGKLADNINESGVFLSLTAKLHASYISRLEKQMGSIVELNAASRFTSLDREKEISRLCEEATEVLKMLPESTLQLPGAKSLATYLQHVRDNFYS
jgi:hypothetical protein